MAQYTDNLNLFKRNPAEEGDQTFNVTTMLNNNWDKIDAFAGSLSGAAIINAGTYTGNNGSSVQIPVDFVPDLLYVRRTGAPTSTATRRTGLAAVGSGYLGSSVDPRYDNEMKYNALAYDAGKLKWSDSGSNTALFNDVGVQYVYVIIGHREVSE